MFYSESKGIWIERIDLGNGKKREVSAKTKNLLAKKLADFDRQTTIGTKFSDVAKKWEIYNTERVSFGTSSAYSAHVKRAIDYFGDAEMQNITPDMIQGYVDELAEMDFAKDTVRRGLVVVNRIFKYYITQPNSLVRFNPCSAVEVPRGLKKTRREPPTEKQIKEVKADSMMGLFASFMLYSGLRNGELLALRWEDIDREEKTITVNKAVEFLGSNPHIKNMTKTEAGMRKVPLLDRLDAVLPIGQHGYVFGGEKPLTKNELYRGWTDWCREHGLAEEIVTIHKSKGKNRRTYKKTTYKPLVTLYQFRHEYASVLEEAGVSEFDTKVAMGHSSIEITKDIYTHIRERKHKSKLADKVNEFLKNEGGI